MTKKELSKRTSELYNAKHNYSYFTPSMVEDLLSNVVDVLIDALIKDGKVTIKGLARLDLIDYGDKPRGAWNPYEQKEMKYVPKKKVRCHFSKRIRDAINEEKE